VVLTLRAGVSTADTDYGTTLLDERSGDYFTLNPSAALVLRTLLAGGSAAEAVTALRTEYAVDEPTANADVDELLSGLRSAGLVAE
jgi:hypothetical protein